MGCAGGRIPQVAVLREDARPQERLHQSQDSFVPDTVTHPVHEGRVVDHVEARLDITFQDPLIGAGSELVNLSDRVMGSAPRAEAIRAWLEVRLEDRLEHQLEGRLHGSVLRGRDAKPAAFAAAWLGDHPLTHG